MRLKCETNMLQDPAEWHQFMQLVRQHDVKSYLEIGSKHGGTWWRMTNRLPPRSRSVSVDLPHADGSFKNSRPNLEACWKELRNRKYDAHLFIGDSTDPEIVKKVQDLGPFDLVFIDANHSDSYVRQDWINYGSLAPMVAFHDVGYRGPRIIKGGMSIDVPDFWKELRGQYRHIEITRSHTNGIGVLWKS